MRSSKQHTATLNKLGLSGESQAVAVAGGPQNWRHSGPKKQYWSVVEEFGAPTYVVDIPGGEAVWLEPGKFTRVTLRDESIAHKRPAPHCDFLYAGIAPVQLPDGKVGEIMQLTQSLLSDGLKQELTARCHFMGANVVTLLLALQMAMTDLSLDEARKRYGPMIESSRDPKTYAMLREQLLRLHAKHVASLDPATLPKPQLLVQL